MAGSMAPVVFEEWPTDSGGRIGVARLSAQRTLNALSLEMIDLLGPQLAGWAADEGIVLVILEAEGDKAFSAGADLHRLHKTMAEHHASARRDDVRGNEYAMAFFGREYRLDYLIHTFPKPVLCWGHGIVMGGGVGLMSGASHRVVTPESRIAMPEITIGLFPDVGGSWLLGRMPGSTGLFLGLTGARIQAADAIFTGMADVCVPQAARQAIYAALPSVPWTQSRRENDRLLGRLLRNHAQDNLPQGPVRQHFDRINSLCASGDLHETAAAIVALQADSDPWFNRAATTLANGSPSTAALTFELLRRARHLSLADVFRMELVVALHCAQRPDLAEGIRALLIDKDQKPRWQPAVLAEVTPEWVQGYFKDPWKPPEHPLVDLGARRSP
jgi:enoyl-CoA hydratase/carnithine racemase